jgi:hypothetical protein
MLIILKERVLSPCRIDSIVSAEFPDPELQPELHDAVQQFVVHGPCDCRPHLSCRQQSSCGLCARHYPKPFTATTRILHDGFPEYRRRGRFHGRDGDRIVGDEWVVPHNPYLLARYRCHINVEIAGHVRSCKYIYKYADGTECIICCVHTEFMMTFLHNLQVLFQSTRSSHCGVERDSGLFVWQTAVLR